MNKKIIQDVLIKKRTIKKTAPVQIETPAEPIIPRQNTDAIPDKENSFLKPREKKEPIVSVYTPSFNPSERKFPAKTIIVISITAIILTASGLFLTAFSSANIKITPRQKYADINLELTAGKNGKSGDLDFETALMEYELSRVSPATGESKTGDKDRASGQVIIYNNYSSIAQKLVANTRFKSSAGKIYRIREAVTVPGMGTSEITIYADGIGPEYNTGLTDFTIPGFEGNPKYEKIFARSKTDVRIGNGSAIITASDIQKAEEDLRKKIEEYLKNNINNGSAKNYISYDNASKIQFQGDEANPKANQFADSENTEFVFRQKGEMIKFFFDKNQFQQILAGKYISEQEKNNIELLSPEKLNFELISANEDNTQIKFKITGQAHFAWKINLSELKNQLSFSAKRRNYASIFSSYPEIENAEVFFKPAWFELMPKDANRIHIDIFY